jgi:hypothetical protein
VQLALLFAVEGDERWTEVTGLTTDVLSTENIVKAAVCQEKRTFYQEENGTQERVCHAKAKENRPGRVCGGNEAKKRAAPEDRGRSAMLGQLFLIDCEVDGQ